MESSDNERVPGRGFRNWGDNSSGGRLLGMRLPQILAVNLAVILCHSMSLGDVTRRKATAHRVLCYVMSVTKRVRVPSGPPYILL